MKRNNIFHKSSHNKKKKLLKNMRLNMGKKHHEKKSENFKTKDLKVDICQLCAVN
jgi:hypothetical protein